MPYPHPDLRRWDGTCDGLLSGLVRDIVGYLRLWGSRAPAPAITEVLCGVLVLSVVDTASGPLTRTPCVICSAREEPAQHADAAFIQAGHQVTVVFDHRGFAHQGDAQ